MKRIFTIISILLITAIIANSEETDDGNYVVIGENPPLKYFDIVELKYAEEPDLAELGIPEEYQISPEEAFNLIQEHRALKGIGKQPEKGLGRGGELTGEYYLCYDVFTNSWEYVFLTRHFYKETHNGIDKIDDNDFDIQRIAETCYDKWDRQLIDAETNKILSAERIAAPSPSTVIKGFFKMGIQHFEKTQIPADKRRAFTIRKFGGNGLQSTIYSRYLEDSIARKLLGVDDVNVEFVAQYLSGNTISCYNSSEGKAYIFLSQPELSFLIKGEEAFWEEINSRKVWLMERGSSRDFTFGDGNVKKWDDYLIEGIPNPGDK